MLTIILIFAVINLSYWIFIFRKLSLFENTCGNSLSENNKSGKTAIIISAKNEAQNLKNNLSSFLNQKPQDFHLIVIDDHSDDETLTILDNISPKYPHLRVLKNEDRPGKKYALSYAIRNTNKDYLLFTDADCYANSDNWLKKMTSLLNEKTKIVLGYSPYTGKSFLSKFIRFETFMTALQYLSYALAGLPYMGVGRNMAIEKSFFNDSNGYNSHLELQSGNDDLFVNENANAGNTTIQIDPETFIYTTPPQTLKEFIRQKTRHISTSFRYKTIHKFLLSLYAFSILGFYIFLISGLFILPLKTIVLIWSLRMIVILAISFRSFILLKEEDLIIWFPILDFLMFLYYMVMGFYYFFADKNRW